MEPPIVLEILDRFGKIRERHRITQFPCRIGRGYHNDIIIDDPYISPTHVELIVDGNNNVILNDCSSENGTFNTHPVQRVDTTLVQENQRIRIGHTDLRLRSPHFPVHETIRVRGKPRSATVRLAAYLLIPLMWLLVGSLLLWNTYLETVVDVTFNQVLYKALPFLLFLPIWAFVWSIVSKIVTHRFYYLHHTVWVSLVLLVLILVESALQYIEFGTAIDSLTDRVTLFTDVMFIAILFYGHLHYSTTYSRQRSAVIAIIIGLALTFTLDLVGYLAQPPFVGQPQFSGILKPPAFVWREGKTIESFFANSATLTRFDEDTDTRSNP